MKTSDEEFDSLHDAILTGSSNDVLGALEEMEANKDDLHFPYQEDRKKRAGGGYFPNEELLVPGRTALQRVTQRRRTANEAIAICDEIEKILKDWGAEDGRSNP